MLLTQELLVAAVQCRYSGQSMSCSPTLNLWLYTGYRCYHKVKAGYILDKLPVHHSDIEKKTSIHTHNYQQFRVANYPNLHVFGS